MILPSIEIVEFIDLFGKVLDASDTVLHEPRTGNPEIFVPALAVSQLNILACAGIHQEDVPVTRHIAACPCECDVLPVGIP